MKQGADVVVLGAGFAGLACATALTEAGARVRVLEASGAPGGRAGSFREASTGEMMDVGQHLLVGANQDALALLRRFGSDHHLTFQHSLAIDYAWRGGRRERLACPPLPAPLHLAAGLLRFKALPFQERAACLGLGRAARSFGRALRAGRAGRPRLPAAPRSARAAANGFMPRDEETVRGWLSRMGQGANASRLLWEPLAVAALNDLPQRAAASLFARVLAETFSGSRASCGLGWARGPLRDLVEPAGLWLAARGGALSCSSPAERLRFGGNRVRAVELRDGSELRASLYVSALPARALLHLLAESPTALRPLAETCQRFAPRVTPILSVYLWNERPLLEAPLCALPDGVFPWMFERRMTLPTPEHPSGTWVQTLILSGARGWMERADAVILQAAREQVEATFPGSAARLRHMRVVRQPAATFEPAPDLLPHRPGPGTPAANLFLAGDWTDTGLPSTLEGAARSGHAAARAVLASGG
jgi:zeta-carotene desaturase